MTRTIKFAGGAEFSVSPTPLDNRNSPAGRAWRCFAFENGDVSALRAAFVDDAEYTLTTVTETQGEDGAAQTNTVTEDLSPWSVRGDLLVRRDGTVLVWMGQPTAEELLAALLGQEGSV